MKKIIFFILILIIIMLIFNNNQKVIVPKESIRFRVIPNSNDLKDYHIKEQLLYNINDNIKIMGEFQNINDSRKYINNNLDKIDNVVKDTFELNNYKLDYNIKYGLNYFPEKEYKGVKYESGYYESLVIEIGEAKGDNFWCVMFPPLCFLEVEENEKVEYKFLIKEIIDNILSNKKASSK